MNEAVPISYEFVVDDTYQKNLSQAMWHNLLRRPLGMAGLGLGVGTAIWAFSTLARTPMFATALIIVSLYALYSQTLGLRPQARRYVATALPLAETFGIGFGTDAIAQCGRTGSSQTTYEHVIGVSRVGGLIQVKYSDKRLSYYPSDLIPQQVIDTVNHTIRSRRSAT
jgi:hypothetical protein